jgi:hypothetical protein
MTRDVRNVVTSITVITASPAQEGSQGTLLASLHPMCLVKSKYRATYLTRCISHVLRVPESNCDSNA